MKQLYVSTYLLLVHSYIELNLVENIDYKTKFYIKLINFVLGQVSGTNCRRIRDKRPTCKSTHGRI